MGKSSSVRSRLGLFALVAAVAPLALGGSAGAQITVGQIAPDLAAVNDSCNSVSGSNDLQTKIAAGASYQVPVGGLLTSWSTYPRTAGSLGLAVYRPVAGQYLLWATEGPRSLTPGVINTTPVAIAVQPGDLVGLVVPPAGTSCRFDTASSGDELIYRAGNAAPDTTFAFDPKNKETERRLNVSATLLPPPAIASLSPAKGSIEGAKVTIAGANFAGVSAVAFGGVPAQSFTVDNEGQITATAPQSKRLARVPVSVTTPAGTAVAPKTYLYEGCRVPKLTGKKLKASKKAARKADCRIGEVKKLGGATANTGEVTKQNPIPGRILVPGSKVTVTLAE